jgi:preprotein translocase subunit SecG
MGPLFQIVLSILAIFLILLILVQRGRGGGLTGALGGMGGSSAFGAKAGDVFTRITIVTATIWICVCAGAVFWANHRSDRLAGSSDATHSSNTPLDEKKSGETGSTSGTGTTAPAKSDSTGAANAPPSGSATPPEPAAGGQTTAPAETAPAQPAPPAETPATEGK